MERQDICSWKAGPLLTIGFRKLFNDPRRITEPYLSDGMTAMDVGCGMGFFTIPKSEIVGSGGKIIAVDLQPEMLDGMRKNAQKAGSGNITAHLCAKDSLSVEQWNGTVDFAIVFWMLHEVPDAQRLIHEIHAVLAPNGRLLFSEPIMHVSKGNYLRSLDMITQMGFTTIAAPKIPISRTTVFQKAG